MKKILILHGVNLNMFGKRDPKYYGTFTLADVDRKLQELGRELGVEAVCFQTNCEGRMCERIHQAFEEKVDAVVIIQKREEFRHRSMISDIAEGYIAGFGIDSYLLGLRAAVSAAGNRDGGMTVGRD
jgi:3-dehydroquinate dehydratase-2